MAKTAFTIEVEGLDEAIRRVQSITSALEAKDVEKVLLKGMRMVRDEVKARAPVGPTGNLKRSVKAQIGKRRGRFVAGAFSAIDRKIAPHAHLVEYGHDLVKGGKKGRGGRVVGHVPAHPFFRPAWDSKQAEVKRQVEADLRALIEGRL